MNITDAIRNEKKVNSSKNYKTLANNKWLWSSQQYIEEFHSQIICIRAHFFAIPCCRCFRSMLRFYLTFLLWFNPAHK